MREVGSKQRKDGKKKWLSLFPGSTVMKHDFQYLTLTAVVHTNAKSAFTSVDDHGIEKPSRFSSHMTEMTLNCQSMGTMLGEGIHNARTVCVVTEHCCVTPYFLSKSDSKFRSHSVPL